MSFSKNKISINIIMPQSKKLNEAQVKALIRDELDQELEDKHAIVSYQDKGLNAGIPSGLVFNDQGNFYRLLAPIEQSQTGEAGRKYNTRIGNEINLKRLDISSYLSYTYPTIGATSNLQNQKLAVRIMIVRAKNFGQYDKALDDMPTNLLLQTSSAAAGHVGSYDGEPLDSFSSINRDAFAVRYDKVHYLNAPTITFGATSTDTSSVPSKSVMWQHSIKFGKNGLKLKYANTTATEPDFPYFMIIGYSSMSAGTIPSNGLVRMSMFSRATYQDA